MLTARIRFKKEGKAKFISHLDLNRFMMRAVRRAGIPVWFTEGFNPHPRIVFALPLSIFYESTCESMDIRIEGVMSFDEIKSRLSAQMPPGLGIISVTEPVMPLNDIAYASYSSTIFSDGADKKAAENAIALLKSLQKINVDKKTKRAVSRIDIKEIIERSSYEAMDGSLKIDAVFPAGNSSSLNPSCLSDALTEYTTFTPCLQTVRRTGIFDCGMEDFV